MIFAVSSARQTTFQFQSQSKKIQTVKRQSKENPSFGISKKNLAAGGITAGLGAVSFLWGNVDAVSKLPLFAKEFDGGLTEFGLFASFMGLMIFLLGDLKKDS